MPVGFSTSEFIWISLEKHKDLPEETRPAFKCYFPSTGHVHQIEQLLEEAAKAASNDVNAAAVDKAVLLRVKGWRNVAAEDGTPLDFSAEALGQFTYLEKAELARKVVSDTAASEMDNFLSRSRSASAGARSVQDAPAVNAPIVQQN